MKTWLVGTLALVLGASAASADPSLINSQYGLPPVTVAAVAPMRTVATMPVMTFAPATSCCSTFAAPSAACCQSAAMPIATTVPVVSAFPSTTFVAPAPTVVARPVLVRTQVLVPAQPRRAFWGW